MFHITCLVRSFRSTALLSLATFVFLLSSSLAGAQSTVSPTSLSFGTVVVGATSVAKTVTLKNTQTSSLTIDSTATSGSPFAVAASPTTTCGGTLAAGASCKIGVTFSPTAVASGQKGSLTIATSATNGPLTVALSGTGEVQTTMKPASASFGSVAVGTISSTTPFTLTNNQASVLTINSGLFSGPFALDTSSNTTCPIANGTVNGILAGGASCVIGVTFDPITSGAATGSLTVEDNSTEGGVTSTLTGTGISPVTLSATTVSFGSQAIGETSAIKSVTVTNKQSTAYPLNFTSLNITGDTQFALDPSSTCSTTGSLAGGGAKCVLAFTFTPTATNAQPSGTLTIIDNAGNSPQTITLNGTGVAQTTLTPATSNFGSIAAGTTSATKSFKLTNNQTGALTIRSVAFSGPFALDTSATSPTTCSMSGGMISGTLASGASCVIGVTFDPTQVGAATGSVTVEDNAPEGPVSSILSGTGTAPVTLSLSTDNFGNQAVGSTGGTKNITLTNRANTALYIDSVVASAGFVVTDPTCTIPGSLAGGANCTIGVAFDPTSPGAQTGTLTITDGAVTSPQMVTLTGTGTEPPVLSTTSVSFGNVALNPNPVPTATVTYTNYLGGALTIRSETLTSTAFAISPQTTCPTAAGSTLASQASCNFVFTFSPTSSGPQTATFTITTNASNSPQGVTLSGTGTQNTYSIGGSVAWPASGVTGVVTLGTNGQSVGVTYPNTSFTFPTNLATGTAYNITVTGQPVGGTCAVTNDASGTVGTSNITNVAVSCTQTLSITTGTTLPAGTAGVAYSQALAATGGSGTGYTWTVTSGGSSLSAAGLSLSSGGVVSGATPIAGTANFTAKVTDSVGNTASQSFSVTINTPTTISPTSINFGNVAVNQASSVQNVTLTNNQTVALNIGSIAVSSTGGYAFASTTAPYPQCSYSGSSSLAAGATCAIGLALTPGAVGPVTQGTLTVVSGAAGAQTVTLNGTGVLPVVVSPSSLTFTAQLEGTTSASQPVTVNNQQTIPVLFSSPTIAGANSGDFAVLPSNTCTGTLPGGKTCALSVTFTPSLSGTETATLNINDNAAGSPQTITLAGTGSAPVTVTPTSITSFTAPVGSTSTSQTITITNNNSATPLSISSFQFNGNFSQATTTTGTNLCAPPPTSLASGASCNLQVQFGPTIGGLRTGQMAINDSAVTSPQVVNLSGTGTSPLTLSTSSLNFTAQKIGTNSSPQTITFTNHESESETFTLATSANFTATTNCATGTIAANSSCILSVIFAPGNTTPSGPVNGSLTIANSAPGGLPLTVSLNGSATTSNPAAAVAVVAPGAAAAGTTVNVVITGNEYTNFTGSSAAPSTSSAISFSDANGGAIASQITVQSFTAVSANQINATLVIAGGANAVYGATNITVASPLSGGGTETAQLNSAFIIADPSNAHSIVSVTPALGTQGQTLNVALTAIGTNFVPGVTYANFGDGVTINYLTVTDATDAQANITISNTTPVGYRTITLVTGGEFATSSSQAFQIGPNNASLVSISPNTSGQGTSLPVTIVGLNTHWLQNATQFSFTGGIIVGNVQVNSPINATVQLAVPANAVPGLQNVTASTGGEIATLANAFSVISTSPYLISVNPSSAQQGQQNVNVEIQGANTNFSMASPANVIADLTGEITVNSVTVNSPTDVVVNISVSQVANVGAITARLTSIDASGNATIFPFTFNVTASAASIVSVTPNNVPQGGQVTLAVTGANTNWNPSTTTAGFYPQPAATPIVNEITVTNATDATLNVTVPTNTPPGTYTFYIATGGQVVSSSITVYADTPSLTMSPANGMPGTSFTANFNGQFTQFSQSNTVPVISGQGVTLSNFTVNSLVSASATVTISANAATDLDNLQSNTTSPPCGYGRSVTFTTGEEIVATCFSVSTTPIELVGIDPYHAPPNNTLNVAITGLNTHFSASATTVQFGPQITVNSVNVTDATHLTANITTSYLDNAVSTPSQPGWQQVYVNTGTEQLLGGFDVDPPASPTLLSVSPSSAAQGSTVDVTITGSLTNWVQGTTEAILGAGVTVADLTITSPTTATATLAVSPTAPVGPNSVTMITGSEVVGGTGFSVTPSAAYIASVAEPSQGCNAILSTYVNCSGSSSSAAPVVSQLQTVTLNVTGVGTHWLQGETTMSFGTGVTVDQLTVNSQTTATVKITVLSDAPVGYATLTANTDGEVATLQQAIDIEEGFPTLLAISPGGGEQGATMTLQVLGRFTHFQAGVTSLAFNPTGVTGITVNSINVIDNDNLTANITVEPWAYIDYVNPCSHVLTVTTGEEQVSTAPILDNFCVGAGAAQINSISSLAGAQGTTATATITGSLTNFIQGVTQVSFGDPNFQVGQITVNSPTSLTASVAIATDATPGYKTVTVTTYGEIATQQYAFTVTPSQPTLTEANPYQAEQGAQNLNVVLTGQYTHFDSNTTATFGAGIVVNSVTLNSPTQLTANISIDPLSYVGSRTVTVTTPDVPCADQPANITYVGCSPGQTTGTGAEIVSDSAFGIIQGPAIISQVAPNTGNEGQEVVFNITGTSTHWQQNFTQFYIAGGGSDLTINSVIINSPTSATVDMSISPTANPGTRSIYMVTAGESLTDSGAFVVTGGVPVVTYLSPNNGVQGTNQLQVTINGLYTNWMPGATSINFGAGITVTSYQVEDATHIEALINIGATAQPGYRSVVVATGTQGLIGNFLVTAPPPPPTPFVWYESPTSGIPGQTLTINFAGVNTEWNPGTTTLTGWDSSNVAVNTFQVTGPTTATANITINSSAPAETMGLTFTTTGTANYGTEVDNARFTIVIAQPVLSIVDPGSGMQGAGLNGTQPITVNILGQFTAFDGTTTFSFGPGITVNGPPTVLGPTIATQTITVGQETPTGAYLVVATTPDAPALAQVVSGAYFTVTPSLAMISAITPNTSQQGTTTTVEVTGSNTHWNGSTVFQFGSGITVTSATVNTETDATLVLSVPALAPEGPTNANATTGGEVANINNGFVVTAGTPYLLSSGPGSLPQQSSAIFTILSQETTWSPATPPVVSYGAGIIVTNVNVTGPTSMTVEGYVQPTTPVGYRNLTVSSGTQVLSLPNAFYVVPGPAVINSVTPSSGGQGVNLPAVQINGTNTNWQPGVTTLNFPGVLVNSFTVNSPTSITANITVNVSATPGQVSVTATTGGEVATEVNAFTIVQTQPELLSAVSSSGTQGLTESVVLTGLYTHFSSTSTVSFGAGITVNSINATSNTSITANITVQPTATTGSRNVSVVSEGGSETVVLVNGFAVTSGPAAILSLSPASGAQRASLTVLVTGSQTHFASSLTSAVFYGGISVTGISVVDSLHANVTISIPSTMPLGSYDVTLVTGGEVATILGGFTVTTGPPTLGFSPTSLTFATQNTGTTSTAQSFTVTATGGQTVNLSSITITGTNAGDYVISARSCGATLASGASCSVSVTFTPTASGMRSAAVTFTDNATGSPQTVALSGTGQVASTTLGLSTTSLTFAMQNTGTTSAAQSFTVTATGNQAVNLSSIAITGANAGDFALSANTCGATLASGANCSVGVTFTPTASGTRTAAVTITDNATGSPQTVSLVGTGQTPTTTLTLSTTSLTFSAQNTGTTSASQGFSITNTGTTALTFTSIAITGTNASEFNISSNNCGSSLAVGNSCSVSVTFSPTATGTQTAAVTITDNATGSPQTVSLVGTGQTPTTTLTLSTTSLTFSAQNTGTTSASQGFSITNTGTTALTFTSIAITGTNASEFNISSNNCGSSLAVGNSCSVSVTFSPTASGTQTAAVTITDNTTGSPQSVSLTGTGQTPATSVSVSPTTLTFNPQNLNSTSPSQTITISNTGNATATISGAALTGTNAGDFAIASNSCSSLSVNGSCSIQVTFTPSALGARTATLTISGSGVTGLPQNVTLNGTGQSTTTFNFSPGSLSFGSPNVGDTQSESLTITNSGSVAGYFTSFALGGTNPSQFSITANTCPTGTTALAAGSTCTVTIGLTPTQSGALSANLVVTDNATNSPQVIFLGGNGASQSQILATEYLSVNFGSQNVGSTSSQQQNWVQNIGNTDVSLSSIAITGTNAGDFAIASNGCGAAPYNNTLTPSQYCYVYVTFSPAATGPRTASLTYTDNATGSPQSVALNGNGTTAAAAAQMNVTEISAGTVNVGTTETDFGYAYIYNTGTIPLMISSVTLTGANAGDFSIGTNQCATSYPSGVPVGVQCYVSVSFAPSITGQESATLNFNDNASTSPQTVAVSGTGQGVSESLLSESPEIFFGGEYVGMTASQLYVYVVNNGTATVDFTSFSITGANAGDFAITTNECSSNYPSGIPAGVQCYIYASFTPSAVGSRNAALSIASSAAGSPLNIPLNGVGLASSLTLAASPTSLSFSGPVGFTTTAQSVTVANTGAEPVQFNSALAITGSADFAITTNSCPGSGSSLAAGSSCSVTITFTPVTTGSATASLGFTSSAGSQAVALNGTGQSPTQTLSITPSTVNFANALAIGQTGMAQAVVLQNTGTESVNLTGFTITGTNATDFAVNSDQCPSTLAAGTSCTVGITFTPSISTAESATLNIADSATGSPQTVTLSGAASSNASDLSASPATLDLGVLNVGTTSGQSTVNLTNLGSTANISFSGYSITGANASDFAISYNQCNLSYGTSGLPASGTCYLYITFTPSAAGIRTATLQISDSASGSPQSIPLQGIGQAVTASAFVSPAAYDFGVSNVGASTQSSWFYLNNIGNTNLTGISVAITGANASDFSITNLYNCTNTNSVSPASYCQVYLTFTPTATGVRTATLTFTDSAGTQTVALSGTGQTATATAHASPAAYDFGVSNVGTAEGNSAFYLSDTGTVSLTGISATISGTNAADFSITYNGCTGSVGANSYCQVNVDFTPSAAGIRSATLAFTDNAGTQTVPLTGTGQTATTTAYPSPAAHDFGVSNVGTAEGNSAFYLSDSGTANLTGISAAISGTNASDFSITYNGCTGSVGANSYCQVNVDFTPSAAGVRTATLTFTDSAGTQTVALSGTGQSATPSLVISPTALAFSAVPGLSAGTKYVYFTNTGTAGITFTADSITGTNASDFAVSNNYCVSSYSTGGGLANSGYCFIGINFTPTGTGTETATLSVTNSSSGSPAMISLTGQVQTAQKVLSLGDYLNFGSDQVGQTTASDEWIYDQGTTAVTLSNVTIGGDNPNDFTLYTTSSTYCQPGTTITSGSQCLLYVQFTPTASGLRTATVQLTDNATGSVSSVALVGTGYAAAATITSIDSTASATAVNSTSNTSVTFETNGTPSLTGATFTVTGANAADYTIGSTSCGPTYCNVPLQFTPSAAGPRIAAIEITASDATTSYASIVGDGIGGAGYIALDPNGLEFDATNVGAIASYQPVLVTNSGQGNVNMSALSFSGTAASDFSIYSNNCGTTLAPESSCYLYVQFTPSAAGLRTASLQIADDASNSPQTLSLVGIGQPVTETLYTNQASLDFGATNDGGTNSNSVSVYSAGTGNVLLSGIQITGTNATDFSIYSDSCGTVLSSSCSISIYFTPSIVGPETASLAITSNATGSPLTIPLTGLGTANTDSLSLNLANIDFGVVGLNGQNTGSVSVTNTGTQSVLFTAPTLTGTNAADFTVTSSTCASLAPGSTCTVYLAFTPSTSGERTAILNINDNVPGSPQTVNLTGTGQVVTQMLNSSAATLDLGIQNVGSQSSSAYVYLTSTGSGTVTIASTALSGTNAADFQIASNSCGTSITSGSSCYIYVTFLPSISGPEIATLTINSNSSGGPVVVMLTGEGQTPTKQLAASVSELDLGTMTVGSTSSYQSVAVTNLGTAAVQFFPPTLAGTNASNFAIYSNGCPSSLPAGGGCYIYVNFSPTAPGPATATLSINSTASGGPLTVTLNGTGTTAAGAILRIAPPAFGSATVGQSSSEYIYAYNVGTSAANMSSVSISGANASDFTISANECTGQVGAGSECYVYVTFTPSATGARTANLVFADNAAGSPQIAVLSGTGQ